MAKDEGDGFDPLGEIRDATTPTYRPDVLFTDVPLSPPIDGGAGGWTSVPSDGVAAAGDSTGLADASDVQAAVEKRFAALEGEHRAALERQRQTLQREATARRTPATQQRPRVAQQAPSQPPPQQAPPQQSQQQTPPTWRPQEPRTNIPPMGVPRTPNPLGRAPRTATPRSPVRQRSTAAKARTAIILTGLLVALFTGAGGVLSSISNFFDNGTDFSFGGDSERTCAPQVDDGGPIAVTPQPVDAGGGASIPDLRSAQTVRFEVAASGTDAARVSVYGDTPDTRTCELSLPWAAEAPIGDAETVYLGVSSYDDTTSALTCRVYVDGRLITQSLGVGDVQCPARIARALGTESEDEQEGLSTGALEAAEPWDVPSAALPTNADAEALLEATGLRTVRANDYSGASNDRDFGELAVPATVPLQPDPQRGRVGVILSADSSADAPLRCTLRVGGVVVDQNVSRGSYVSCDTTLEKLGLP